MPKYMVTTPTCWIAKGLYAFVLQSRKVTDSIVSYMVYLTVLRLGIEMQRIGFDLENAGYNLRPVFRTRHSDLPIYKTDSRDYISMNYIDKVILK